VLTRFHILANFFVTVETFEIRNTTRGFMALQAIVMSMLQIIVSNRQRPRGQQLIEQTFKFHLLILSLSLSLSLSLECRKE
jgi:hypothetical protein